MSLLTLGGGCFWCLEAVFSHMIGVASVVSGYAGGDVDNPTYNAVCSGSTGHAEVIQIKYDEKVTSVTELLDVFWEVHDPTTLNRQGNDVGTQYRSVIYYANEEQHKEVLSSLEKAKKEFGSPIVTQIEPLDVFYEAEEYHQNYFKNNPNQGYCQVVIKPKVDKFKKVFKDKALK